MPKFLLFWLRIGLIGILALLTSPISSAQAMDAEPDAAAEINVAEELILLQRQLDDIRQAVATVEGDTQMATLGSRAVSLTNAANILLTELRRRQAQVDSQLGVLGTTQEEATETETAEVTRRRNELTEQKNVLDAQVEQTRRIRERATSLSTQITSLRRDSLKTQLALNSGTILRPAFWAPIFRPLPEDFNRLSALRQDLNVLLVTAWDPVWRYGTLFLLLAAAALGTLGYRLLNRFTVWIGTEVLPAGHLRRSFLAVATVVVIVLVTWITVSSAVEAFLRIGIMSAPINEIGHELIKLVTFCSTIGALGKGFLSTERPSWRLPKIADPVAQAMKPFPLVIAALVFLFGFIEIINSAINTSLATTLVVNGLTSLLIALFTLLIARRGNRERHLLLDKGQEPEARSGLAALIRIGVVATCLAVLVALIIGYILLAHFLTYQMLWIGVVLSLLYLLINLAVDISEAVFLPAKTSGERLKRSLRLDDRHMAQANSIVTAASKITLILLAAFILLNGTFGSLTPVELLHNATETWSEEGLERLNLVPGRLFSAALLVFVGLYVLRATRRWLECDFLPKTAMDIGIQASLVTLFTNLGYVLIILMTLATLGIQWNSLTWIVSALSVGIGFGLQEIVKNFISGLILLTERPVKVGDLVSISGIEGDIRRISVRATEVELSDRSTVIVPNSQFISQNVRNVTMGGAQGVVTIELKFPLDIDPDKVRELLLNTYSEHKSILSSPAPTVTFKQLDGDGVVLSATGYVKSPRMVSGAKSDLIYQILKRRQALKKADDAGETETT